MPVQFGPQHLNFRRRGSADRTRSQSLAVAQFTRRGGHLLRQLFGFFSHPFYLYTPGINPARCAHAALSFLTFMKAFLGCVAMAALLVTNTQADRPEDQTPAQLKQDIEKRHPADYYLLASKLFK